MEVNVLNLQQTRLTKAHKARARLPESAHSEGLEGNLLDAPAMGAAYAARGLVHLRRNPSSR